MDRWVTPATTEWFAFFYFLYFLIRRSGDAWNAVVQSRKLSLYLPNEIPNPRAELVIVLK